MALCVVAPTNPQASGLTDAQSLFYNGRCEAAAALTLALRGSNTEDLAVGELRSSALLFQIKALLEGRPKKEDALSEAVGHAGPGTGHAAGDRGRTKAGTRLP